MRRSVSISPQLRDRAAYRAARAMSALPPRAQIRLSGGVAVEVDGQRLEPEIQLTLAMLERQGDLRFELLDPPEARELARRQSVTFAGPAVDVGAVRDLAVDGAAGPLRARLYSPEEPGGPHPLLVFYHGGGFVIGDLDTHDGACRLLCRHAGVHVLAVDYRLAPEHPFPAATDDAWAALRWAAAHAADLGADPERVAVGGDSAGGNLAAVVAQRSAREGGPALALQLLIYPTVDAAERRPSFELFADGFFLTRPQMEWFTAHYLSGAQVDPADPRISPLRAPDLSGLAPAFIVTSAFDPLRDEGEAYAAALRKAGNSVGLRRFGGMIHGFINMVSVSRVSHDALIEIAGATRALLGHAR